MDCGKYMYEDDDAAWTPQEDPESGLVFYYNNMTGEPTLSEPPSTTPRRKKVQKNKLKF